MTLRLGVSLGLGWNKKGAGLITTPPIDLVNGTPVFSVTQLPPIKYTNARQ